MPSVKVHTQKNQHQQKFVQRVLQVFSNLSRSFLPALLGIFLNYLLVNHKANGVLTTYVYSISIINLLFVFTNWGGKSHLTKTYAKEPSANRELTGRLLGSKLLLCLIIFPLVFFLPVELPVKLFIAAYLVLKTTGQIMEALIVIRKKYHVALVLDSFLGIALLFVIFLDGNFGNPVLFLIQLLVMELIRNLIYLFLFRAEISLTFNIDKCLQMIKSSAMFFYISLAGFLCSRADLYATGFFLGKQSMGLYYVITNLVGFCLIAYAAINGTFEAGIIRYSQKSFVKFVQGSLYTGFVFSVFSALAVYVACAHYFKIEPGFLFCFLIVANVFGFTRVLMQMYRYTRNENQAVVLRCLLISGCTNIILSCLLTKLMGATGAFTANTVAVYVNLLLLKKGGGVELNKPVNQ